LGELTFFFDRTFGKRLPRALASLKPPMEIRWHQGQNFPANMPDDEWLAIAGQKGWVVLSQDLRFHLRENELEAIKQHAARCFYFPCASEDRWFSMRLFVRGHTRIMSLADMNAGPFIFSLKKNGQFYPVTLK
jgi:hypothetical protein